MMKSKKKIDFEIGMSLNSLTIVTQKMKNNRKIDFLRNLRNSKIEIQTKNKKIEKMRRKRRQILPRNRELQDNCLRGH